MNKENILALASLFESGEAFDINGVRVMESSHG